jgi:hypothetical protein
MRKWATFGRIKRTNMYSNIRIQLPLGLKQKFSFSNFRENFVFSRKISVRKLTKIAETLENEAQD